MKTEKTNVTGTIYIWAIPKSEWQLKNELDLAHGDASKVMPFTYELRSFNSHYLEDAVCVHEFDVVGTVPEGIDLIKAAVQTMRDEIAKIRAEAQKKVEVLEEKIKNLALLTYQPGD